MKSQLYILTIILIAVACSSPQGIPPSSHDRPPHFNEVSGNFIHADKTPSLRHEESVKAYTLGRRIDHNDSSIMHEESIIYRVENDSAWNLQPGIPEKLPFGDQKQVFQKDDPRLLKAEIEVKANEQRALYKYLKKAAEKADGQIDALKESAKISRSLLEQNKALKAKLLLSQQTNKRLTHDLSRLKEQVQALMKFYQQKQQEKIKSQFRRKP